MGERNVGERMVKWLRRGLLLSVVLLPFLFMTLFAGCGLMDGGGEGIRNTAGHPDGGVETQEGDVLEPGSSEEEEEALETGSPKEENLEVGLSEDGVYTSKEDVSLFIHLYGRLPDNFITKKEARDLGWNGGSLEPYAPGKCIGGDRFGNYEGNLPEGKRYTECDIDTLGADSRGAKRIVFSSEGQIYYTEDHYESFTQLYD